MIIRPLQHENNINCTSGKSTLFTDFDGTFLPQPLHDLYNGSPAAKNEAVSNLNIYFSQIQDFITRKKGDFGPRPRLGAVAECARLRRRRDG